LPRNLLVGNGRLTLALDNQENIRDFFYPMVGLENHLVGHRFRLGVWTDDQFSWLGDRWEITQKYLPDTLVSRCLARSRDLEIELEINDGVHNFLDVFLRKVEVRNLGRKSREIRLFFTQDFHIYGTDAGDTVMFGPVGRSIIHYKRQRYFLVNGATSQNGGIFQFATGVKEAFGKEGTWRDAEDGDLRGNPIAQGSVDSAVSFSLEVPPNSNGFIYYWIACGEKMEQVENLDIRVKKVGVEQLLLETENFGSAWVSRQDIDLSFLPRNMRRLFKSSLLIMRAHVDDGGAIIASCDSDILQSLGGTYSYVWPRDGALTALALDMAGFQEVSRSFFQFCSHVISPKGFFYHKYLPDGSIGSSWHALIDSRGHSQLPIQEDETALVLYALWRHFQRYHDLEFIAKVYDPLVIQATDFLLEHRDEKTGLPKPSFDLWEEKFGVSTATTATVCAALVSAAKFARVFFDSRRQEMLNAAAARMKDAMLTNLYDKSLGRFIKAIHPDGSRDTTIDSSLAFTFLYGPFEDDEEAVVKTVNSIYNRLWLKTTIGGLARYDNDEYYRISPEVPGNPWFICALWLARWYIARASSLAQLKHGADLLDWIIRHTPPSGILAEQINPFDGTPLSVSPLTWSHAEYVMAVCEYIDKYRKLTGPGKF
jgi:GH15 family glucan-1,4-alpha-glucosidase